VSEWLALELIFYYFWNSMHGRVAFKQNPLHWANFLQKLEPELTFWHVFLSCPLPRSLADFHGEQRQIYRKKSMYFWLQPALKCILRLLFHRNKKAFGKHPAC